MATTAFFILYSFFFISISICNNYTFLLFRNSHTSEKNIKEPDGGAQNDINFVANEIKSNLINEIKILQNKTVRELLNERYLRYRYF